MYHGMAERVYQDFGKNYNYEIPDGLPGDASDYFVSYGHHDDVEDLVLVRPPVKCNPLPGKVIHVPSSSLKMMNDN